MKTTSVIGKIAILGLISAAAVGCSSFTSIERQENGQYVLTGWQSPGPVGFLWVGEYDKNSRTLTIVEKH